MWSAHRWLVVLARCSCSPSGRWTRSARRRSTPFPIYPIRRSSSTREWMGRSPDLVEDQITYPLVRALQSTPGVRTVRGYSMFGMSFIYAIFGDDTDIYWARTRVLEQLGRVQQQSSRRRRAHTRTRCERRRLDLSVRPGGSLRADSILRAARAPGLHGSTGAAGRTGVAEVASSAASSASIRFCSIRESSRRTGDAARRCRASRARRKRRGGRARARNGRARVRAARSRLRQDARGSRAKCGHASRRGGTPIRLRDVATVQFGPEIRRGAADWNGAEKPSAALW